MDNKWYKIKFYFFYLTDFSGIQDKKAGERINLIGVDLI